MNTRFYIEYRSIPMRHHNTQTIETSDLKLFVHIVEDNKLELTNHAKRTLHIGQYGALVGRVYQESEDQSELQILYKHCQHFGKRLTEILRPAPKEVFV